MLLKIASWNVNGLRAAAKKGFLEWLEASEFDVVGLQEVRARAEQLPEPLRKPRGWQSHFVAAEKKGYSGVGIYARHDWDDITATIGVAEFDAEGRVQIARFGALTIVNVYFPNGSGKNRDKSRIPFKLAFYERLRTMLAESVASGGRIVVMGDFNTAHAEIDLARPGANRLTSGFCDSEREELTRWLGAGWTDSFRHFHPESTDRYSWWSQRFGVRERNVGWRIDMAYVSDGALPFLTAADILHDVMGSDHCPITLTFDPAVTT